MTKHLIDGPLGKLTLASFVSLSFVLWNIRTLGKTKLFPSGTYTEYILSTLLIKPHYLVITPTDAGAESFITPLITK